MTRSLGLAKKLGEEVHGTSKNSIYILCATNTEFNVAIRDNSGTISIRIEMCMGGSIDPTTRNLLIKCGFTGDENGKYMSQHFKMTKSDPLTGCGAYGATMEQLRYLFPANMIATLPWKDLANAGN